MKIKSFDSFYCSEREGQTSSKTKVKPPLDSLDFLPYTILDPTFTGDAVTAAKHLILSAITKRAERTGMFRAREVTADTGLSKQLVNYHLREWERKGFVSRNPLNTQERVLVDLPSLLEEMSSSSEYEGAKTYHMRDKHTIFNPEEITKLRDAVDTYVALKYLGFKVSKYKLTLEEYLDKAIEELRRERAYMHNKKMADRTAAKYLNKHLDRVEVTGVSLEDVQNKVQEILEKDKRGLRLVEPEAIEEETVEPEEETEPLEVRDARNTLKLYEEMMGMPEHPAAVKAREILSNYDSI